MKSKLIAFILLVVNLFALTPQEKSDLLFMYEEEKLARDVYQTLGNIYPNMIIFSNIARSEIMHNRAVAKVLKHYNVKLPNRLEEIGKFKNEKLQKLYNELVVKGKKSLKDALEVGIMVEVIDVEDLDKRITRAKSEDVIALFKFLKEGSYNHYNVFDRALRWATGGKGACEVMDKKWCKNYPFQPGLGRFYRQYYWFPIEFMSYGWGGCHSKGCYGNRGCYGWRGY